MSQIIKTLTSGGPIPPIIPTSFVTQDGTAVPAANILIVNGFDSRENNNDGIITKGGVVGTGTSNEVDVVITNRMTNAAVVTTTDATPTPLITFTPTVVGTYTIECRIAAYNTTSLLGAGYSIFQCIRFDGINSNLCGVIDRIVNEEGAMSSCQITTTVSVADLFINVIGYGTETINWNAVALYTFVGA